ncbi:MAG: hypothetical protein ACRDYA_02120 [Egibacteraceae bacterium]
MSAWGVEFVIAGKASAPRDQAFRMIVRYWLDVAARRTLERTAQRM